MHTFRNKKWQCSTKVCSPIWKFNPKTSLFVQKWVRKYWTLTTMEHKETKDIHNYGIDLNKW